MGHIKEPEGIDFIINSRQLTKEEEVALSKYIREHNTKHSRKRAKSRRKNRTTKLKTRSVK